jgi:hypothetical protein
MSHTVKVKSVVIRSVSALRAAVSELNSKGIVCELLNDQKPRMYFDGQHGKCELVLRMQGCKYDVGFEKQKDGTYTPVMDTWSNYLKDVIGDKRVEGDAGHIAKFLRAYTKAATIEAATEAGYMIESVDEHVDGSCVVNIQTEY